MKDSSRPISLGRWLRRHSIALVAVVGAAAGVGYAAARREPQRPAVAQPQVEPAAAEVDAVQDTVQIALLLDTSGSMDGLINQARSHLWSMVDRLGRMTRVVDGKVRGVKVELALYEYGNDTLPAASGYMRQVLPFTTDLDKVSEQLHKLFTNGGSEYAGQAIKTAVEQLAWSANPDALRFVFLAGNEEFDQGPISAAQAMAAAAKKDINVQLIHCGADEPTWRAAANLAHSDLFNIDQNFVAQHVPAPQDDQILALSRQLNDTYLAYGDDGAAAIERQSKADLSSAKMSKKVAIERAQLKAKPTYKNDKWDLVDAHAKNAKLLEKTDEAKLPTKLQGKSFEEKVRIVEKASAERADLQAKIKTLEAERARFLEAEQKKQAGAQQQSLESELMKSAARAASQKGYKP